jgi:hypothetical protein
MPVTSLYAEIVPVKRIEIKPVCGSFTDDKHEWHEKRRYLNIEGAEGTENGGY